MTKTLYQAQQAIRINDEYEIHEMDLIVVDGFHYDGARWVNITPGNEGSGCPFKEYDVLKELGYQAALEELMQHFAAWKLESIINKHGIYQWACSHEGIFMDELSISFWFNDIRVTPALLADLNYAPDIVIDEIKPSNSGDQVVVCVSIRVTLDQLRQTPHFKKLLEAF